MIQIIDILNKNRQVKKTLKTLQVTKYLKQNWDIIFTQLSTHLKLSHVKAQTVFIYADNPAWVTEIKRYEKEFLKKINTCLNVKEKITSLYVYYSDTLQEKERELGIYMVSSKPLLDKIKDKEKKLAARGYLACLKCGKVFVEAQKKTCVFCEINNR